jgi:quercetin dioxygenase-like cupin family protein
MAAEPTVIRGTRATIQRGNGLRYRPISGGEGALRLNALHVTVPRRRRHHAFSQHDGEELLYVLAGTLVLTLNRQSHTLVAGDSAHFDSKIPHRVTASGDCDAEVLLVSYAPASIGHQDLKPVSAGDPIARSAHERDYPHAQLCAAMPDGESVTRTLAKS